MKTWLAGGGWYDASTRTMKIDQVMSFVSWNDAADYMKMLITLSTTVNSDYALYMLEDVSFVYQTPLDQVFFIRELR